MIDLFASSPHYFEHLAPIWAALPSAVTGDRYSARSTQTWRTTRLPRPVALRGVQPVLVAAYVDYLRTYPAPVVYVEHGAGQTYDGDPLSAGHSSYAGGDDLDRVVLFVCPSEQVADRWRQRYPDTRAVAVGCAKLDPWHRQTFHVAQFSTSLTASEPTSTRSPAVTTAAGRTIEHLDGAASASQRSSAAACSSTVAPGTVVALTFHWDCPLVPETLSAWRHYDRQLAHVAQWARSEHVEVLGHGHPRLWRQIVDRWRRLEIEPVQQFSDVLDRARVLAFDNSSAGFEFASCDRPVVVMNAPWYRRDVDHGGRFWRWADVGAQVDDPSMLITAIEHALSDPHALAESRRRVVGEVYAHVDGHAAERAADEIVKVLDDGDTIRLRARPGLRGF